MAETHDHTSENNMSDLDNGCESSAMLSRRGFLKGIGALAIGAVSVKATIDPALTAQAASNKTDLKRSIDILAGSKMLSDLFAELQSKGFVFSIPESVDRLSFRRSSKTPTNVGLSLIPIKTPQNRQLSASIIATIDLQGSQLRAICYDLMIGNDTDVRIKTTLLFADGGKRERDISVILDDTNTRRDPLMNRPRTGASKVSALIPRQDNVTAFCQTCTGWIYYNCQQSVECCQDVWQCTVKRYFKDCTSCSGSGSWREYKDVTLGCLPC